MTEHIPECLHDDRTYGLRGLCICDELRACEQRIRLADDDYAYVAGQAEADGRRRGWNEALDAAREAVDALPTEQTVKEGVSEFWVEINHAIAAIDALREKPLASGGIYAGSPIPLGDGCVIPKSDAIDALKEKP